MEISERETEQKELAEKAYIVYASDDRFAEILGVSLVSLYDNNPEFQEIFVYILDSGISEENRRKLDSIAAQYGRAALQYIKAVNISEQLSMQVNLDRGSTSQYARLFVSSVLSSDIHRVLYLDCDIIINQSIRELWCMDLQGNIIGALGDAFSKQYRKNIDLEPHDVMFNSGVMLIDLDLWRRDNVEQKLLAFIKKKNGNIQQGDQGALNAILSRQTYCFEPRFNSVTIFYDFTYEEMLAYRKPVDFYSKEEVAKAIEDPVLIHFTTSFLSRRPWYDGCQHKYAGRWKTYKDKSPWKDAPNWAFQEPSGAKGLYIRLTSKLPRKAVIWFSSLLQVYGRPFLYSLNRGKS